MHTTLLLPCPLACIGCWNWAVGVKYPFIDGLLVLFGCWVGTVTILRLVVRKRLGEAGGSLPGGRAMRSFVWAGVFVLVGVPFFLGRSIGMLLIPVWLTYLCITLMAAFRQRSGTPLAKSYLFVNATALVLAGIVAPLAIRSARSAAGMVASLGNPVFSITSSLVIPGVLSHGESAVEPLIDAVDAALPTDRTSTGGDEYRLCQLVYCLGEIGGPKAEEFLRTLVTKRIVYHKVLSWRWHSIACCAYAKCAGQRAIPDLIDMHAAGRDKKIRNAEIAPLAALARTADLKAVEYVLDHMPTLLEGSRSNDVSERRIPHFTAQALIEGKTASDLTSSRFYKILRIGIDVELFDTPPKLGGFHRIPDRERLHDLNSLEQKWKTFEQAIRGHWASTLK